MLSIVNTIKTNRFLIKTWVKYNIQSNYIDTKLGIFWIILQPIFQTLIYTLVFGTLLGRNARGGVPFIIFFLAGTSVWQFMNNNWMQASNIIVRNINLMSQVKISAEAVVIVQFVESLVDFGINLVILVVFSILFGYFPTQYYFYLPLMLAIILLVTLGGMYFISGLGVFIRDIPTVLSMILRLLFFVSGVIITPDMMSEKIQGPMSLNPLLQMIEAVRNIVLYAEAPTMKSIVYMTSFSMLVFLVGYRYFKKRQGVFVDYQ